jgi:2-keto-4-pentenoate hydratase/2-oxohepta-3-ene-1,7-dioic acid hydratase in catechol pathway
MSSVWRTSVVNKAYHSISVKRNAGFTVAHDVSARDWQLKKNGGQWLLGKAFDGFAPLGPAIVTLDEIGDPHKLRLRTIVNGTVLQDGNTSALVHKTEDLVAYISKFVTLKAGDIILTG